MVKELVMVGLMMCQVRSPDQDIYLVSNRAKSKGTFVTISNTKVPVSLDRKKIVTKVDCGDLVMSYRYFSKRDKNVSIKITQNEED